MKKILLISISLILILSLSSCGDITFTGEEHIESTHDIDSTCDIDNTKNEEPMEHIAEYKLETFEEYNEFVENNPYFFIPYESIEYLGDFHSFSYTLRSLAPIDINDIDTNKFIKDEWGLHEYTYELNGGKIKIDIFQHCTTESFSLEPFESSMLKKEYKAFEGNELVSVTEENMPVGYHLKFNMQSLDEPMSVFYTYNRNSDRSYLDNIKFCVLASHSICTEDPPSYHHHYSDNVMLGVTITFGDNAIGGYDFGTEEANDFLYADTAGKALVKFNMRVLLFSEDEALKDSNYEYIDYVLTNHTIKRLK